MGLDGQLAAAVLATLGNRQVAALETITRLGDAQADSPKGAWLRTLTLRINQDWRVLKTPATASRLEKLEYFRARRATAPDRRASQELQDLKETAAADFARIAQSSAASVEDGNEFVADSVVRELSELATVYQRAFKRPMAAALPGAIPLGYWTFFETVAAHEGIVGRVPSHRSWFIAPVADAGRHRRH